jgi:hypothetical protein
LRQINIPAEVEITGTGATVNLPDGRPEDARGQRGGGDDDGSWSVSEQEGKTIFHEYGSAGTLSVNY